MRPIVRILLAILPISLINSCSPDYCYTPRALGHFTNYKIQITDRTSVHSVGLDDPGGALNKEQVENTLVRVASCVQEIAHTGFTDEEYVKGECRGKTIDTTLQSCLTIKVAPDWYTSKCSGEQVFPCDIGSSRCIQKGQAPTQECPCACRGAIQDGKVVIITPNLRLLPGTFTTLLTGCLSPWIGRLNTCSSSNNIPKTPN